MIPEDAWWSPNLLTTQRSWQLAHCLDFSVSWLNALHKPCRCFQQVAVKAAALSRAAATAAKDAQDRDTWAGLLQFNALLGFDAAGMHS